MSLRKVVDSEDETYAVENVGLPASVQSSNGIELRIEVRHDCASSIGLET
jgi:hypothetical protein